MAIEYGFINAFPALFIDMVGNIMYYIAMQSTDYISLLFGFIVAGLLFGTIAYLGYISFGMMKKNYTNMQSVLK